MTPNEAATKINRLAAEVIGRIFTSGDKAEVERFVEQAVATATAELAAKLAEAEKRADWAELCLRSFIANTLAMSHSGFFLAVPAGEGMIRYQDTAIEVIDGLPIETPELRQALEQALAKGAE